MAFRVARAPVRLPAARRSKYGAVPVMVDGHRFASKAEARRYGELKLLQIAGEIQHLQLQPRFPLSVPCEHPGAEDLDAPIILGVYIADFQYLDVMRPSGQTVVEDVKGVATALYKWKKKHVEAQYGIVITEVR